MRPPRSAGSRERLLFHLKTKGAQSAAGLARRLGVTAMAVRQHLARLEDEGLVAYRDEAGRVGRPRRIWSLTTAAEERFPDSHAELAFGMIEAARNAFGEEGLARLLDKRLESQVDAYRQRMPDQEASLKDRVAALAHLRREEGYMADWSSKDGGAFELVENHCPICAAAQLCAGLCAGEVGLFRQLLGPEVEVERIEYILEGDRRCTYSVRPKGLETSTQ